jgi:hypothetical protein
LARKPLRTFLSSCLSTKLTGRGDGITGGEITRHIIAVVVVPFV